MEEVKKMPKDLYWEWRCTIEEGKVAKLNERRIADELSLLQKDIEILTLKSKLKHSVAQEVKKHRQKCDSDYKEMVSRIEKELDISFKDCVIDEVTFEIKPLET